MAENPFRIPTSRDIEQLAFDGRVSVSELCRRAGIHPSTFRYWKNGRTSPSVIIVQALLDAGWAAKEAAERAETKAPPRKRQPRAKPKPRAVPARLVSQAGRPA